MSSAMSYPRTATRLGSMRVTAVFQTAFLSVSLIRLSFHLLENFNHCARQFAIRTDHSGAGFTQRLHFTGVRAATALNDRARVTESRALTRRFAADVRDYRLGHFSVANQ